MIELLETVLATWRVAYMLVKEAGPGEVFTKLRAASGIEEDALGMVVIRNTWTPLACVFCASLWVAPILILVPRSIRRVLAYSAGATLVEMARG